MDVMMTCKSLREMLFLSLSLSIISIFLLHSLPRCVLNQQLIHTFIVPSPPLVIDPTLQDIQYQFLTLWIMQVVNLTKH